MRKKTEERKKEKQRTLLKMTALKLCTIINDQCFHSDVRTAAYKNLVDVCLLLCQQEENPMFVSIVEDHGKYSVFYQEKKIDKQEIQEVKETIEKYALVAADTARPYETRKQAKEIMKSMIAIEKEKGSPFSVTFLKNGKIFVQEERK